MLEKRFEVFRQATDVLFRRLDGLPPSDTVEDLRAKVRDCMRKAREWTASSTANRERDELMKRVLGLHVELVKLERQVPQVYAEARMAS
jgi:hypothetical protein